jgi:flagellar hook-length control protein FliK
VLPVDLITGIKQMGYSEGNKPSSESGIGFLSILENMLKPESLSGTALKDSNVFHQRIMTKTNYPSQDALAGKQVRKGSESEGGGEGEKSGGITALLNFLGFLFTRGLPDNVTEIPSWLKGLVSLFNSSEGDNPNNPETKEAFPQSKQALNLIDLLSETVNKSIKHTETSSGIDYPSLFGLISQLVTGAEKIGFTAGDSDVSAILSDCPKTQPLKSIRSAWIDQSLHVDLFGLVPDQTTEVKPENSGIGIFVEIVERLEQLMSKAEENQSVLSLKDTKKMKSWSDRLLEALQSNLKESSNEIKESYKDVQFVHLALSKQDESVVKGWIKQPRLKEKSDNTTVTIDNAEYNRYLTKSIEAMAVSAQTLPLVSTTFEEINQTTGSDWQPQTTLPVSLEPDVSIPTQEISPFNQVDYPGFDLRNEIRSDLSLIQKELQVETVSLDVIRSERPDMTQSGREDQVNYEESLEEDLLSDFSEKTTFNLAQKDKEGSFDRNQETSLSGNRPVVAISSEVESKPMTSQGQTSYSTGQQLIKTDTPVKSNEFGSVVANMSKPLPIENMGELISSFSRGIKNQVSNWHLRLYPEELGSLEMRVRVENGQIHAELTAYTVKALECIEASLSDLQRNLLNQGINLASLVVGLSQEKGTSFSDRQRFDRRNQQSSSANRMVQATKKTMVVLPGEYQYADHSTTVDMLV